MQIKTSLFDSIFISISSENDGRAPCGQATFIASIFCKTDDWFSISTNEYNEKKKYILTQIIEILNEYFGLQFEDWLHSELATPKSFLKWTGRPAGIVGGLGQYPFSSGLFGLSSRTPFKGFWLCGDSIHPGEGTAGVTQSALMACRQLIASRENIRRSNRLSRK